MQSIYPPPIFYAEVGAVVQRLSHTVEERTERFKVDLLMVDVNGLHSSQPHTGSKFTRTVEVTIKDARGDGCSHEMRWNVGDRR